MLVQPAQLCPVTSTNISHFLLDRNPLNNQLTILRTLLEHSPQHRHLNTVRVRMGIPTRMLQLRLQLQLHTIRHIIRDRHPPLTHHVNLQFLDTAIIHHHTVRHRYLKHPHTGTASNSSILSNHHINNPSAVQHMHTQAQCLFLRGRICTVRQLVPHRIQSMGKPPSSMIIEHQ